jgi:hypothetical protein
MLIARRRILQLAGLSGLTLSLCPARAFAGDKARGEQLALEAEKANSGYGSERVRFTLMLVNAHGEQTERRLSLEVLEQGEDDLSRITFDWPAAVRGTTLLTHSKKNGDDDQWFYLPATKAVRRISAGHHLRGPVVTGREQVRARAAQGGGRCGTCLSRARAASQE